jgi:NAD(P)-dependent dehydrogenase (short-subunit alcohol dehydrogenase family)
VPPSPESAVLSAEHTFVLAGGLGTLGLALARTLVDVGARHIVMLSRSGTVRDVHQSLINDLTRDGCLFDVVVCDISREADVQRFVSRAESERWQIKGVLQCATALKVRSFSLPLYTYSV